jgi:hypothetical protein
MYVNDIFEQVLGREIKPRDLKDMIIGDTRDSEVKMIEVQPFTGERAEQRACQRTC